MKQSKSLMQNAAEIRANGLPPTTTVVGICGRLENVQHRWFLPPASHHLTFASSPIGHRLFLLQLSNLISDTKFQKINSNRSKRLLSKRCPLVSYRPLPEPLYDTVIDNDTLVLVRAKASTASDAGMFFDIDCHHGLPSDSGKAADEAAQIKLNPAAGARVRSIRPIRS